MHPNRRQVLGLMAGAPAVLAIPGVDARAEALALLVSPRETAAREIHGVHPADMDLAADPRDDFYRYANGGWMDRVTIPSDRASYGVFVELDQRTTEQLLGLLNNLADSAALDGGSDEWKTVQLFRQGTDIATRNAQGIAPVVPGLDRIREIASLADLHAFLPEAQWRSIPHVFGVTVDSDLADSSAHALYYSGPFLGMPNRDYYLDDTDANEASREAYVAACAELLALAGHDPAAALIDAEAVYAFERQLAAETLTREQQQDFALIYNPLTVEELSQLYPLMDWPAYFDELGLRGVDRVIATELNYLRELDDIVRGTPLDIIRNYLTLSAMWSYAPYLSEEIETAAFAFESALRGVDEQLPLDQRVLDEVGDALPHAVGKLYVGGYFPPEAKRKITELVDEVIRAFDARIAAVTWMTPETKERARAKLAALGVKVGYPDRWLTYGDVEVGDSYVASILSARAVELRRTFARYGQPVDRSEWFDPPHTVNAFYNPVANDITFPAAILQAPFFDYQADPASNYGAIGYVIGHEITHGFDRTGAQFDAAGNLANWWSERDVEAFAALNRLAVEQYGGIEVLPGVSVNGQVTVGENVADLGGVQVAFDALAHHLAEHGASLDAIVDAPLSQATPEAAASPVAALATPVASPVVATPAAAAAARELSQRERFFIAAATVWRTKIRDEALVTQVQTDVHSPAIVRATQPLRNTDAFHETFGIRPGDAMYLAPGDRVVIW